MHIRSFTIIGLLFVLLNTAQARSIEEWSYDRLLKTAAGQVDSNLSVRQVGSAK